MIQNVVRYVTHVTIQLESLEKQRGVAIIQCCIYSLYTVVTSPTNHSILVECMNRAKTLTRRMYLKRFTSN